jgi:hypothetical protein
LRIRGRAVLSQADPALDRVDFSETVSFKVGPTAGKGGRRGGQLQRIFVSLVFIAVIQIYRLIFPLDDSGGLFYNAPTCAP